MYFSAEFSSNINATLIYALKSQWNALKHVALFDVLI